MDKREFERLLFDAELTKKKFAHLLGASHQTIINWGNSGKNIPYWVESWLENYIELQELKKHKHTVAKDFKSSKSLIIHKIIDVLLEMDEN